MIFESSMQLWITHNGEREKLRFPVLPTKFDVTHGTKNTSVTISGLGEILVLQDRAAVEVSWDSFFPAAYFPGIQTPFMLSSPDAMIQRLFEWKISAKPVHLILTGTRVNFYAAIQSLQPYRKGGDPGSIYYKIKLKEYREVRIRQVKVSSTGTATVSGGSTRTDNRVQASQLFALMFLDEFDHIIKEKYRIKYYGRYMDDFYIICSDKKKLQCILRDVRALMDSYGLELNQKTAIFPLRNGIDFLGFHSYLTDTGAVIQKLRRDSSKRMKNKIRYWETAYPAGEVTKQEILRSFDAWDAHAAHGDTYSLRRKYADRLEKLLDCKIPIHRKINSNKLARDRRRARQCRCIYKNQHKALSLSVSQNTRPAEIMPWA